jgi:hypothetical protein
VVVAPPDSNLAWVMSPVLSRFVCGDALRPGEVTRQQICVVFGRPDDYEGIAPRPVGGKPVDLDAACDAMLLDRLPLPALLKETLRFRPMASFEAEKIGSLTVEAASVAGGRRAEPVVRLVEKALGRDDGGLDDLLRITPGPDVIGINPPFFVAQQSFGGIHPDVAESKKQPTKAASRLITPEGGMDPKAVTKAQRARVSIWPALKDDPTIRLIILGFLKSSPGGPHVNVDHRSPPGRAPHSAQRAFRPNAPGRERQHERRRVLALLPPASCGGGSETAAEAVPPGDARPSRVGIGPRPPSCRFCQ